MEQPRKFCYHCYHGSPGLNCLDCQQNGHTVKEWKEMELAVGEKDPNGFAPKQLGAKLDAGKSPVHRGLFAYFPRACRAVADVSLFGANKYAWKGWESVPNGIERYADAGARHVLDESIEGPYAKDSGLLHKAHKAWNAFAELELYLRELEKQNAA